MPVKKKKVTSPHAKRAKAPEKKARQAAPEADPEWDALEERYSQIGSEMHSLAKLLNINGDGGAQ
jgi:hypothetical protein